MIKCELLHFGRRNAKRGCPGWAAASGGPGAQSGLKAEYQDDIARPFLAAVTPAVKTTDRNPVCSSSSPPASGFGFFVPPYTSALSRSVKRMNRKDLLFQLFTSTQIIYPECVRE